MAAALKFKKADRLLSKRDFTFVFDSAHIRSNRRGGLVRSDPYIIYRAPQTDSPRLGLSISRRVLRHAADRNRVKRCVREFFRLNKNKISGDIVIRLVKVPSILTYESLTPALECLLVSKDL